MKGSSKKRTNAKESRLLRRTKELEEKLATSIPKAEFDAVKLNLQLEIDDLQKRLSDSVPRADLDYVKNELQRICDLEGKLAPVRSEETDELRIRISELEKLLRATPGTSMELDGRVSAAEIQTSGSQQQPLKGESHGVEMETESRFTELQQALSDSRKETDALREKISEMKSPTDASSDPATDSEESEIKDSDDDEDSEDSEEPDITESYIQSQITDP